MIGIMPHLTCNQAMVLLDIYRGTFEFSRHMKTVMHDIEMLVEKEYIADGGGHACTRLGEDRVKFMLN